MTNHIRLGFSDSEHALVGSHNFALMHKIVRVDGKFKLDKSLGTSGSGGKF